MCLQNGTGISPDLKGAVHYFKLSADQGNAAGQCQWGMCLLAGKVVQRDITNAIQYFKLSAENGSPQGQAIVGWMTENGIGTRMNLIEAVRYYEMCSNRSSDGCSLYGRCCQTGRGIPVDFTVAAEFFQLSADCDNPVGANSFGYCLEKGEGVEQDINRAVRYYRNAASQSHPGGLYNFGRCLEYGKGIQQDFIRAAKYYCLSAELNEPSAENSYGICLERGIGVQSNLTLAAHYYQRSAAHGDSDGANNLGFCLEHGRGVKQNIESAAECYKFASDHGHPEGELNYRRCLRILGQWTVPDRSSRIADSRPLDDHFTHLFIDCHDDPNASPELIDSIERLKPSIKNSPGVTAKLVWGELGCGDSGIVTLAAESKGNLIAVKTSSNSRIIEMIRREVTVLKTLNHPLVVNCRGHFPDNGSSAMATEFVGNGSLANHLPSAKNADFCQLRGPNRIVKIICGIVLAMDWIHSRNIIHRDLTPHNILLDWDWNIRIADFGHNHSPDKPPIPRFFGIECVPSVDFHYLAPESSDGKIVPENDVFSFGAILYELIVGQPLFPKTMGFWKIAKLMLMTEWEPNVPDFVLSETRKLIYDCLTVDYLERPSFSEILERLEGMKFKLMAGVNSLKIKEFVKQIKAHEADLVKQG
jgi:TPR repeat protein